MRSPGTKCRLKNWLLNKYIPCAIMPKTKSRSHNTSGNYETRFVAAHTFQKGDRVQHRVTRKVGAFQEINMSYALPEVWVQFESDSEIVVPTSCNPLDLELMSSDSNQAEEIPLMSEPSDAEAILVAAVEVFEELTEAELADLYRLEHKVERAFYEAGKALLELRERRLYRSTHKTWEAYCKDRFGFGRDSADTKILASQVVEEIRESLPTNRRQILPTTLEQVRPLIKLKDALVRIDAWVKAVDENNGKVPSGRIVKGIVERLKSKPLYSASDFCSTGDVFVLARLEGAERKYNSCWAIASDVKDFTVVVDVHDTRLIVKPENLKPIDEPDVRRQLPQILKRIRRLRECGLLDRCAYTVLESLGRQTYLTSLEEKMLKLMEQEYGIND